ncbi:uncharacterized protein ACR2FA_006494 [Aphomia sociella]
MSNPEKVFRKLLDDIVKKRQYKKPSINVKPISTGGANYTSVLDGTVHVVPVDFQTLFCGSPLMDLMYFIFTGSDEHFRRRHFWDLIDYYYRELCSALSNLGLDPHRLYPKDDFDQDVKEFLPYGFMIALFMLHIITVNVEDAPSLGGNTDMTSFMNTKTSSYYPERLNGVINDFIRWGFI